MQWVKCMAVTPPELGANAFDSGANFPIYVPNMALDSYLSHSGWAEYKDRLIPFELT